MTSSPPAPSGTNDQLSPIRSSRPIVINRLRWHPPTRAYVAKRTADGKTKKEIIRCLKRAVVREVYRALQTDLLRT